MSLGLKWILPNELADTGGHFAIHLEWVKETSVYRTFGSVGWLTLERVGLELRPAQLTHPY